MSVALDPHTHTQTHALGRSMWDWTGALVLQVHHSKNKNQESGEMVCGCRLQVTAVTTIRSPHPASW